MDYIVIILQIIRDLLGRLNPFKLLKTDYLASFREIWKQEAVVFRIGYLLGILGVIILIVVLVFMFWKASKGH